MNLNREQFLAAAMMIGALNAAACTRSSKDNTAGAETAPVATAEAAPPPAAEGGPVPTAEAPPIPTAEGPRVPGVAVLPLPEPFAGAVPAATAVGTQAVRRVQELIPGLPIGAPPGR